MVCPVVRPSRKASPFCDDARRRRAGRVLWGSPLRGRVRFWLLRLADYAATARPTPLGRARAPATVVAPDSSCPGPFEPRGRASSDRSWKRATHASTARGREGLGPGWTWELRYLTPRGGHADARPPGRKAACHRGEVLVAPSASASGTVTGCRRCEHSDLSLGRALRRRSSVVLPGCSWPWLQERRDGGLR